MNDLCLFLLILSILSLVVESCNKIRMTSKLLGDLVFEPVDLDNDGTEDMMFSRGRPVYSAFDEKRNVKNFLYHAQVDGDGLARWIINEKLGVSDQALAYINSWAVTPNLIYTMHDRFEWWITDQDKNWMVDSTFEVTCEGEDNTFYFEGSPLQPSTAGFFIERTLSRVPEANQAAPIVFTKVVSAEDDPKLYLFKHGNKWMIGETLFDDSCYAYVEDDATLPSGIKNTKWMYVSAAAEDHFVEDNNEIIHQGLTIAEADVEFASVYEALRYYRSVKYVPEGQRYLTMRNNVPIPQLGLGTGGIALLK